MINAALFRTAYTKINLIFAGIILCIFVYSGFFTSGGAGYPISSGYTQITGEETNSTGMSRAFSSIVRLEFKEALSFNEESLKVFAFFFIQFFLRFLFTLIYSQYRGKNVVTADVVISLALFLYCFEGLF
jgi:hypothetical protein